MAAETYRTIPRGTYGNAGTQTNHDIGPLTTHHTDHKQQQSSSNDVYAIKQRPKYYLRDKYDGQLVYNQTRSPNDNSNSQTQRSPILHQYQTSYTSTTTQHPSAVSQSSRARSDHQSSYPPAKQLSSGRRRSLSLSGNSYESETTTKRDNLPVETKTNKSSEMRAAAIRQKEEIREQKQNNGNYLLNKKKSHTHSTHNPWTESKDRDANKTRRNIKQSHYVPRYHRNDPEDFIAADNSSSIDENNNEVYTQNKPVKRIVLPENTRKNNASLPPVRRGRGALYHDSGISLPLPHGHPLRGRYPHSDVYTSDQQHTQYDNRRRRHSNEDVYDDTPHPNSHNKCVECKKRQMKSGSGKYEYEIETAAARKGINRHKHYPYEDNDNEGAHQHGSYHYNEPIYNDDRDTYDTSPEDRHDNSKNKLQSNGHDALYAQQSLSTDSYVENQRRRALRDAQGYYFPYKQYTLKDYKDFKKSESQFNPYGSYNESNLDRKELARKRREYAAQIEKPIVDGSGEEHKTPRDISSRKPLLLNHAQSQDTEKVSKRDRALEYGKVQVSKHRQNQTSKNKSSRPDPTEQYINSLFPEVADDDENEGQHNKNNPSHDDQDTK